MCLYADQELSALKPHERFRLWLTTESHDAFPTILLQQAVKLTYEAPPGLKKNLERTYDVRDVCALSPLPQASTHSMEHSMSAPLSVPLGSFGSLQLEGGVPSVVGPH
jgi:hypothetical protein